MFALHNCWASWLLQPPGCPSLHLHPPCWTAGVPCKLWVEQPEDFATCLATAPCRKSLVAPHVKKLQLCKGA